MKPKVSDTVLTKLSGKRPSEEYRSDRGARLLKNMPKCSGVTVRPNTFLHNITKVKTSVLELGVYAFCTGSDP